MHISQKIYFCILITHFTQTVPKSYSSEYVSSTSSITFNDKEFTHSKKSDNGISTEQFLINRVPVEKDQFINELNTCRLHEMNENDKEVSRKKADQESMRTDLKKDVLRKLITQSITDLNTELSTLQEPILKPYLTFNNQEIASASDLEQLELWIDQIQKNLKLNLGQDLILLQQLA